MKSFCISIILFVILLVLVATNAIYLTNSVKALVETIELISIDNKQSFYNSYNIAHDKWQKLKSKASLSCYHSEISAIDLLFEQLSVYFEQENHYDFATAKRTLVFNLNELTRLEKAFD